MLLWLMYWTGGAWAWWLLALGLLRRIEREEQESPSVDGERPPITIFKAAPRMGEGEDPRDVLGSLGSFLGQMREGDEMLLGLHGEERRRWEPVLGELRERYPGGNLRVLERGGGEAWANPKIGAYRRMAEAAGGAWWMWSDLDIWAPGGFLEAMAGAMGEGGYVTGLYRIRRSETVWGAWDALFANAEFLPGAWLLGRRGRVRYACGAAVLFRGGDLTGGAWERMGRSLADDHVLAEELGGGRVCRRLVETTAGGRGAWEVLRHYWRWQKTVRWLQPWGFAGLLGLMPLGAWVGMALMGRVSWAWVGMVWAGEAVLGALLLRQAGYAGTGRAWPAWVWWPWLRLGCWLLAWTPLPVTWRGSVWRGAVAGGKDQGA